MRPALSRRDLLRLGLAGAAAGMTSHAGVVAAPGTCSWEGKRIMKFETIGEGFVDKRDPKGPLPLAVGPRTAVNKKGELFCTYAVRSKMAANDGGVLITRSKDGGVTWESPVHVWPHLEDQYAIYGSISRSPEGDLFFYGARTPRDKAGESVHQTENEGMKPNDLVFARSWDDGQTWSDPTVIPIPIPGAAEAPGAMCITSRGRMLVPYSPYNTFDPKVIVDRNQVVVMWSDDGGKDWQHTSMLRFADRESCAAEAWVVELADKRLLGTAWHVNMRRGGKDYPNAYAISHNSGETWTPTRSTGILGQSTALAALPDGRALFIYNQRKHGTVGVWLALVKPTDSSFGIQVNQPVWKAEQITQKGSTGDFTNWEDFAFGEPSVTLLPDGTLFVAIWYVQPSGQGIRYVKLKMVG